MKIGVPSNDELLFICYLFTFTTQKLRISFLGLTLGLPKSSLLFLCSKREEKTGAVQFTQSM